MKLLTTEQAAEILNTTPINIRKLVFKGRLQSAYPGKGLFDPAEIKRFQAVQKQIAELQERIDKLNKPASPASPSQAIRRLIQEHRSK